MKHHLFLLTLIVAVTSTTAQAQVFKKIGEAAQKAAKKGVETLKQNTKEGINNTAELLVGTKHGKNNDTAEHNDASTAADAETQSAAVNAQQTSSGNNGAPRLGSHPTIEVAFNGYEWAKVTDVYDGIFAIPEYTDRGTVWHFYNVETAAPISRKGWLTQDTPRFDGGVCAACDPTPVKGSSATDPKYQWYILHKTGDTTPLDPSITAVGNFCDGLAVAKANGKMFFIDDKGKTVAPGSQPRSFDTYPLADNRRLFLGGFMKFGYLDGAGRVVIEPQYSRARNFSSNHAIVRNSSGKNVIIDTTGRVVSEIPSQYVSFTGTTVTDFVGGGAVALNTETERYDIITPTLEVRASYDKATAFYNTLIGAEANAIVMNNGWKHPQLCGANGRTLGQDLFVSFRGPNGEEIFIQPEPDGEADNPLAADLLSRSYWNNTGLRLANVYLGRTRGVLFNSMGEKCWEYDNEYYKPESFSQAGYAKGIVRAKQGPKEDTADHNVFFDTTGKIMVEVVDKRE